MVELMMLPATAAVKAQAPAADGAPRPPRFTLVANTGRPMRLAGWRYPVVMDLAGMSIPSQSLPVRHNHDANQGVGHTESVGVESGRLVASGLISRDTPQAREVAAAGLRGFPWQASLGASADEVQWVKEGESAEANGRTFPGPLNVVRKSTLGEISFVDRGADGNTSVSVAAIAAAAHLDTSVVAAMTPAQREELRAELEAIERIAERTRRVFAAARREREEAAWFAAGGPETLIELSIGRARERRRREQAAAFNRRSEDDRERQANRDRYVRDAAEARAGAKLAESARVASHLPALVYCF